MQSSEYNIMHPIPIQRAPLESSYAQLSSSLLLCFLISFYMRCVMQLMEFLRSKHPTMAQVLELVLGDIGSRFVPRPEERLLAVVHALLLRCYKLPFSNAAEVPTSLKRELQGVCKACFSSDTVKRHSRSTKAAVATIADYKDRFIHDLNPEAPGFPPTLGDLAAKLKVCLL